MPGPSPLDEVVPGGLKADQSDAAARLQRKPARTASPVRAERPVAGVGLLLLLVVILATIVFYFQHREAGQRAQEIADLQQELAHMRGVVDGMSAQLSATGASLTEAGSETDKQIRFLDSEIRKLWGVANDRNRKSIEALEARLGKLSAERDSGEKQWASLEARVKKIESGLAGAGRAGEQARKEVDALASEFRDLKAAQEKQQSSAADRQLAMQTRVDQVSAQVSALSGRLRSIEQASGELSALSGRLAAVEASAGASQQAIRSIDAFRIQTNRSLTSLQSAVNEMQKDLDAMKRVY